MYLTGRAEQNACETNGCCSPATSNLRRYIEALGGALEITARFPQETVNITNFSELEEQDNEARGSNRIRPQA